MPASNPLESLNTLPGVQIKLDGNPISPSFTIVQVETWKELNKIARARIQLLGGDANLSTFMESEDAAFAPGVAVEISMGYAQELTTVFKGVLTRHRIAIRSGYTQQSMRSTLILDCADKAVQMTMDRVTELFEKKKDSEVLEAVIARFGLTKSVEGTDFEHPALIQYDCSSWDFLLRRARACGLVVLNSDNTLTLETPAVSERGGVAVVYGQSILSFEGEVDATTQQAKVVAKGWDPFKEEALSQQAEEPSGLDQPGDLSGLTLAGVAAPDSLNVQAGAPLSAVELKSLADATLRESRMRRVRGKVLFPGVADITLGSVLTLSGLGSRFNGDVYVAAVRHLLDDGYFSTEVGFGLPKDTLCESIEPRNWWAEKLHGLHIGTVKQIESDPDSAYRILVVIPHLDENKTGIWARLSQFYTTSAAGSFFIPEVDSEVVVGFLNEDPRFPVILGGLYNAKHAPYQAIEKENSKKAILSKEKITIEFDDKDKVLTLKTPGGHSLVFSDKEKSITVKDSQGNTIQTGDSGISLSSAKDISIKGGQKVSIEASTGIEISASGGDVKIKGLNVSGEAQIKFSGKGNAQAELTASGQVTVKGALVMIN